MNEHQPLEVDTWNQQRDFQVPKTEVVLKLIAGYFGVGGFSFT